LTNQRKRWRGTHAARGRVCSAQANGARFGQMGPCAISGCSRCRHDDLHHLVSVGSATLGIASRRSRGRCQIELCIRVARIRRIRLASLGGSSAMVMVVMMVVLMLLGRNHCHTTDAARDDDRSLVAGFGLVKVVRRYVIGIRACTAFVVALARLEAAHRVGRCFASEHNQLLQECFANSRWKLDHQSVAVDTIIINVGQYSLCAEAPKRSTIAQAARESLNLSVRSQERS
jgi:hypothetical protein